MNVWGCLLSTRILCVEGGTVRLRSVDERALLNVGIYEGGAEFLIPLLCALMRGWGGIVVVLLEGVMRIRRASRGLVRKVGCALRALVLRVRRALILSFSRSIGCARTVASRRNERALKLA